MSLLPKTTVQVHAGWQWLLADGMITTRTCDTHQYLAMSAKATRTLDRASTP